MQSENTGSGFGNFSGEWIRDCKSLSSGYVPGYATHGSGDYVKESKGLEGLRKQKIEKIRLLVTNLLPA